MNRLQKKSCLDGKNNLDAKISLSLVNKFKSYLHMHILIIYMYNVYIDKKILLISDVATRRKDRVREPEV